ncbi:MAG: YoaP domain-containing protein [Christensenellaceae bacterium]
MPADFKTAFISSHIPAWRFSYSASFPFTTFAVHAYFSIAFSPYVAILPRRGRRCQWTIRRKNRKIQRNRGTESLAAKELPCVFNNRAVFPNGKFVTVNQTDGAAPEKILRRGGK